MEQLLDRKEKEAELHDHLRGDVQNDPHYLSNKKFYSISQSNRNYVKRWLTDRCKGKRVLDYCCGNGGFTVWIAETGADTYGIDISPVSITNAKAKAFLKGLGDRATFYVMDAEKTEFPDDFFDFVVVNGVIHHLDLKRAYGELARILKPDGEIICTEALRHNIFIHFYRKMTPHLRTAWEVDHILGKEDIKLARHYFNKVQIAKFFHLATIGAVPFRNLPIFVPIHTILEAADSILLRIPVLKWWAWMAVFILAQPKK